MANTKITTNVIADDAITLDKMAGIARGKIIYGDSSGNPAVLDVGAAGTVLTSDGTDISWAEEVATNYLPLAGGTMTGNIVMGDDTSIGIGDSSERIEFDGAGDISVLGANFGIGTSSPSYVLDIVGNVNGSVTAAVQNSNAGTSGFARFLSIADAGNAQFGMTSSAYTDITGATDSMLLNANSASGGIAFALDGVLKMKLDSSGRLLIGHSSSVANYGINARTQVQGTGADSSSLSLVRNSDNNNPAYLVLGKTRSASVGGSGLVQNGDTVGDISFTAGDGVDNVSRVATIQAFVDGAASANDTPGRLVFSTTDDGSQDVTERMRIDSSGNVGIGTDSPGSRLEVRGAVNGTSLAEFSGTDGRGLKIFTQKSNYPTDSGQNDAVVVYNAQDSESGAIYSGHVFQYGGNEVLRLQRIESSGNTGAVGINDNAPAYTLDVNTDGESNAMRITQGTNTKDCSVVFQNTATGTGDDTNLTMITAHGAGDPRVRLQVSGYEHWDLFVDNSDSDSFKIYQQSDTRMAFKGGSVGFGTDSPTANLHVSAGNPNNSSDAILYVTKTGGNDFTCWMGAGADDYGLGIRGVGSYAWAVYDHNAGAYRARLQFGGDLYLQNTTVNSISDRRLKKNIVDANSQWNDIKALRWRNFEWKDEYIDGTYLGLIADEVEPISPNLVEINAQPKEDIDAGIEDPEHKAVKYSIVWMKAMKALQEAQERIETLEAKVQALESS